MVVIFAMYVGYHMFFQEEDKTQPEVMPVKKERTTATDLRIGILKYDSINPILSQNRNVQEIARLVFEPLIVNRIKQTKKKSIYYYNVENIKEIKKVDEYTLKITLKEKEPYFEYNLIFPIMSSKYFDESSFTSASKNKNPVGTGMYYIAEKTDNHIMLKPNVSWWQEKNVKIDTIQINIYRGMDEALEAFKDRNVDLITSSNATIEDYLKDEQYQKAEVINRNYQCLVFNCKDATLKNKQVRQAIANSIDQQAIVKSVFHNKYKESYFPLDFGCYLYHTSNQTNKMSGKEIKKQLKTKLTLQLLVNNDDQEALKVADKIQKQLSKVKVTVKIQAKEKEEYQASIKERNYEMALINKNYAYSPSLYSYFGNGNVSNYQSKEMQQLLRKLENTEEEEEATNIVSQIKVLYDKEVPCVGLYYDTITMLYSNSLRGSVTPTSYNLFYHMEDWYREY